MPFSEEELAYIAALDPTADCELLGRELPALRPECGRTLQVATALLKATAAAGLRRASSRGFLVAPLEAVKQVAKTDHRNGTGTSKPENESALVVYHWAPSAIWCICRPQRYSSDARLHACSEIIQQ